MSGWLKLHRAITEHWIWSFDQPDKAMAWMDLLIMARHAPGDVMLKGRVQFVDKGQVAMSQLALQKRWKWSQNKVKRFLKLLEKHGMCDFKTNDLTTIITICNFSEYQTDERTGERPPERPDERPVERTTDDQTNEDIRREEGKEGKKGKKKSSTRAQALDFSAWPKTPSEQVWADYKKLRQTKKAPITQTVVNNMASVLVELEAQNIGVDQALAIACDRGWQGLKAEWVIKHLSNQAPQEFCGGVSRQAALEARNAQAAAEFAAEDGDYFQGNTYEGGTY